jgi:uncharacterized membrane protein
MHQTREASVRDHYEPLLKLPPEQLCWELSSRAKRLRRISDELSAASAVRRDTAVVIEIVVLLVVSVGLVAMALVPLAEASQIDPITGFPTGMSAVAFILAPVSLYALHSVYRGYRKSQRREFTIRRFQERTEQLIRDAEDLADQLRKAPR